MLCFSLRGGVYVFCLYVREFFLISWFQLGGVRSVIRVYLFSHVFVSFARNVVSLGSSFHGARVVRCNEASRGELRGNRTDSFTSIICKLYTCYCSRIPTLANHTVGLVFIWKTSRSEEFENGNSHLITIRLHVGATSLFMSFVCHTDVAELCNDTGI